MYFGQTHQYLLLWILPANIPQHLKQSNSDLCEGDLW